MDNSVPIALLSRVSSMEPWFICAALISYVAVIINFFVFCVLFKKPFVSPATVLLQGLAFADGFSALFMYGFEPFFVGKVSPMSGVNHSFNRTFVTIESSSCGLYVIAMLLACDLFHLMSVLMTTCLGLQKVIAIQFPLWTKTNYTIVYSIICSFVCFMIPAGLNIPLLAAQEFKNRQKNGRDICWMSIRSSGIENYFHNYQPLIASTFLIILCIVMVFSTLFITYKLCNNEFRKTLTRKMYRSIILVFVLLVIFLISEIPRIIVNITYIVEIANIKEMFDDFTFRTVMSGSQQDRKFFSFLFTIRESENTLNFSDKDLTIAIAFFELVKFSTVMASLSNIFIYSAMSKSLRLNFRAVCTWNKGSYERFLDKGLTQICSLYCLCRIKSRRKASDNTVVYTI